MTGFNENDKVPKKESDAAKAELGDMNDLIKSVDIVEQEIKEKKENAPKKRKRGRPSKKEKVEAEQAEKAQIEAMMKVAGVQALKTVITLADSIVKSRVPKWENLKSDETNSLAEALNAVVVKYMPSLENFGEEFGLALVLLSIVGARIPALTKKDAKND